jgi:hypothetical protein
MKQKGKSDRPTSFLPPPPPPPHFWGGGARRYARRPCPASWFACIWVGRLATSDFLAAGCPAVPYSGDVLGARGLSPIRHPGGRARSTPDSLNGFPFSAANPVYLLVAVFAALLIAHMPFLLARACDVPLPARASTRSAFPSTSFSCELMKASIYLLIRVIYI